MSFINKIIAYFFLIKLLLISNIFAENTEEGFNEWIKTYKKFAVEKGISKTTVDEVFLNVKFLNQVIKYDRKQPEFYEDTITYVSKRANNLRIRKAQKLYKENKKLFLEVEKKFLVEKEI